MSWTAYNKKQHWELEGPGDRREKKELLMGHNKLFVTVLGMEPRPHAC